MSVGFIETVWVWVQMEFSFNVNNLLPDAITLVDDKLAPFRSRVKNDR